MTIDHPVKDWAEIMDNLDIQAHYDRTFAAMWAIAFTLTLPQWLCDYTLVPMATQFITKKADSDFFRELYLPELSKVSKKIHIGFFQKISMVRKFSGMIMKIGYSFIW
jgi:hypothetical protein